MSFYKNKQEDKDRIKEITEQIFSEINSNSTNINLESVRRSLNSIRLINGIREVI